MTTKRRIGSANARNRTLLVDATQQVLSEEGYAAVTARRVAAEAGLKVQLVYYYLRALWELNVNPTSAIAASELLALANHRESIRSEIVAEFFRHRASPDDAAVRSSMVQC